MRVEFLPALGVLGAFESFTVSSSALNNHARSWTLPGTEKLECANDMNIKNKMGKHTSFLIWTGFTGEYILHVLFFPFVGGAGI